MNRQSSDRRLVPSPYQLFAYGHRYLPAEGHMLLIYPMTHRFRRPVPVFTYSQQLNLWVVPFDLQSDRLVAHMLLAPEACWLLSDRSAVATRSE